MTQVKTPAVAGMFYPADPAELQDMLKGFLAATHPDSEQRPMALVAPHAGYQYSGPIAAAAYATLAPWADQIRRVVVLAPSHHVPFTGIAASSADSFQTPLGLIPVDRAAVQQLDGDPAVHTLDLAFAQEHALEVQLPFLQTVLQDFQLIPLIVGEARSDDVSRVIESLLRDDTLIVVSSDLSHYLDYQSCRQKDQRTSTAIEHLDPEAIGPYEACGHHPLNGLLQSARQHGWQARILDLRNSGDTSGDKSQVVGYGAYEFH
jgi:AmmeMemoRadiSam system protein B